MNCKPGDLAMVVKAIDPEDMVLLGKVIRVTSIDPDPRWAGTLWRYEGERLRDSLGVAIEAFLDHGLRPINNPGEDETDEMVLLVGKPEEVPA